MKKKQTMNDISDTDNKTELFFDVINRKCTPNIKNALLTSYMNASYNVISFMALTLNLDNLPEGIRESIQILCENSFSLLQLENTTYTDKDHGSSYIIKEEVKQKMLSALTVIMNTLQVASESTWIEPNE